MSKTIEPDAVRALFRRMTHARLANAPKPGETNALMDHWLSVLPSTWDEDTLGAAFLDYSKGSQGRFWPGPGDLMQAYALGTGGSYLGGQSSSETTKEDEVPGCSVCRQWGDAMHRRVRVWKPEPGRRPWGSDENHAPRILSGLVPCLCSVEHDGRGWCDSWLDRDVQAWHEEGIEAMPNPQERDAQRENLEAQRVLARRMGA